MAVYILTKKNGTSTTINTKKHLTRIIKKGGKK